MTLLYSGYDSYYRDGQGRPVVSTFEGPGRARDWEYIIQKTNAAFIPDWSKTNGNTYVDASYIEFLEAAERNCGTDLQYMMPASPWFYTNLPGYKKNWLSGSSYVQIISWNDFGANTGAVVVTVGSMTVDKRPIETSCDDTSGYTNWNAFVASTAGGTVSRTVNSTQWVCIEGTAAAGFDELCAFTCRYGYCPVGACLCTKMGPGNTLPGPDTPGFGTASYWGLCSFACNYGFGCPNAYCDTAEHDLVIPNVSPFTPDACTSGVGEGSLGGLCGFLCNFGFCPIHSCTCTSTGALHLPPGPSDTVTGEADPRVDERIFGPLCEFACSRGYCPEGVCVQVDIDDGNPYKDINVAYIGPEVHSNPTAACESPCVLVLPPSGLPATTTIQLPPYTTSFQVGQTITTTTLYPADIVTDVISFSNINITGSVTDGAVFPRCTSMKPDAIPITLTYVSNSATTVTIRQVDLPPWLQITQGPAEKWTSTCGGWTSGTITNSDIQWTYSPSTAISSSPVPVYTGGVFPPPSRVEPITEPMGNTCSNKRCPSDKEDDDVVIVRVKCDELWFFIFCIDTKIFGWKFTFPKGIMGPGPPPLLHNIEGWKFIHPPNRPAWPKIIFGQPSARDYDSDSDSDSDGNSSTIPPCSLHHSFGTMLIFVRFLPKSLYLNINDMPGIASGNRWQNTVATPQSRRDVEPRTSVPARNMTTLRGRAIDNPTVDDEGNWHRSLISTPRGEKWYVQGLHHYYHDGKLGEGQYVYITEEGILDPAYMLQGASLATYAVEHSIFNGMLSLDAFIHAQNVAQFVVGQTTGIVPRATLVTMPINDQNWMTGFAPGSGWPVELKKIRQKEYLVRYVQDTLDCVWVNSAGNIHDQVIMFPDLSFPTMWKHSREMRDMLVVAATSKHGFLAKLNLAWSVGNGLDVEADIRGQWYQESRLPSPGNTHSWTPGGGSESALTWHAGPVQPTCTANCGKLCTGYYCVPQPTGSPPDFFDPVNTAVSTTTTTTTATTPSSKPNLTPLTRGPINCFNEADYPGHTDIQSNGQDYFSVEFSGVGKGGLTISPGDAPIRFRRTDNYGVNYDYRVEWVDGCVTTVGQQSFQFPISQASPITAYLLVREAFTKCK
ncbi:carbohydrate-binding module family 24 protein [Parathielavia hyrcaniae]|uniref:Carbohydrate-binding module family 24 protein n=1 Tax=Parathielavia hyrcaniae TaxID=113614 RepID=A0AAN6Q3H2_9PEZI|nr:carbohydrate-binding module family 24 protein [Parathielavia hyrcaniae]